MATASAAGRADSADSADDRHEVRMASPPGTAGEEVVDADADADVDASEKDSGGYVPFDPVVADAETLMKELTEDAGAASFYRSFVDDEDGDAADAEQVASPQRRSIALDWRNLTFSINERHGLCGRGGTTSKPILRGLDGFARPGRMLAILGGSGAGKSTLLNMLAGRVPAGKYETGGDIYVNGSQERDMTVFRKNAAYVEQDDAFFPELTVREQIEMSARLRLPHTVSPERKTRRVEQVVDELGLRKVIDSRIGSITERGISGGERKRVNIGTELVTNPRLLLLDEPTSGLDAFQAQAVMLTMLRLARNGRTVVATIHQPRSQIFQMADDLLLLSEGHQVYFGRASEMVAYFSSLRYPCPSYFNPADFALDLISLNPRSKMLERATRARIRYLSEKHAESLDQQPLPDPMPLAKADAGAEAAGWNAGVGTLISGALAWPSAHAASMKRKYNARWTTQFWRLFERSNRLVVRERLANLTRLGQSLFFAVLLGLLWLNIGRTLGESANDKFALAGVLIFLLIQESFNGMFGIIFLLPLESAIVTRERASKTYCVSAYLASKTLSELPRTAVQAALFAVIAYWMVGLRETAASFFIFVLTLLLTVHAAESLALMTAAPFHDAQTAGAVAPIPIVLSLLFSGFLIPPEAMPVWLAWIRFVSFLYYGFNASMLNEFRDAQRDASVLQRYGVNSLGIAVNLALLFALDAGCRVLAYVLLRLTGPRFVK